MITIIEKLKCSGCYACYNICPQKYISMQPDNEGFWYPVVDIEECTDCGLRERKGMSYYYENITENHPVAYTWLALIKIIKLENFVYPGACLLL
jgi:ferredoxin